MKSFNDLSEQKKQPIIKAGLLEFSKYGYLSASTNRIVKSADISKGSLFNYFGSKKNFYVFLVEYANQKLLAYMSSDLIQSDHWKESLLAYASKEYTFHENHPLMMDFHKQLIKNLSLEIFEELKDFLKIKSQDIFFNILSDFDLTLFQQQHILFIVRGYNEWFYNQNYRKKGTETTSEERKIYLQGLEKHLELIGGLNENKSDTN